MRFLGILTIHMRQDELNFKCRTPRLLVRERQTHVYPDRYLASVILDPFAVDVACSLDVVKATYYMTKKVSR